MDLYKRDSSNRFFCFFKMFFLSLRPTFFPYTTLFRSHNTRRAASRRDCPSGSSITGRNGPAGDRRPEGRSEEHTSELQSHHDFVCRIILVKKNTEIIYQKNTAENGY